jgi:hypothetical protein
MSNIVNFAYQTRKKNGLRGEGKDCKRMIKNAHNGTSLFIN